MLRLFTIRVFRVLFLPIACVLLLIPVAAVGQGSYPSRPIDIIVSFAPGGAGDLTGRIVAEFFSKKFGQPINVRNVVGGSGVIGVREGLMARPDGYTILQDSHSQSCMMAMSFPELPFKWDARTPLGKLFNEPVIFAVKADSPLKTLKDVVAKMKSDPKNFKWGTGGIGATGSFAIAELCAASGVDINSLNRVIFNGGAPTLTALAGGHIDFAGQQLSEQISMINGGLIRGLAIVLPNRAPQLPDVPTAQEAGFPMVQMIGWNGLSAPANTSAEIVSVWDSAIREVMRDPAFIEKAINLGKVPAYLGGSDLKKLMYAMYEQYLPLAIKMGITK